MINLEIMSILVGLTGAISNNGKTDETDRIVGDAIMALEAAAVEEHIKKLVLEKNTIAPNCATCKSPCGNTSNYDLKKFESATSEVREKKIMVAKQMIDTMQKLRNNGIVELPNEIYRAISYWGYDMNLDSYDEVIEEMKNIEVN